MTGIDEIAKRRARQLLKDARENPIQPVVGLIDIGLIKNNPVYGAATVEEISRDHMKAVIVWRERADTHSLWVRASYTNYRRAFEKFAQRVYPDVDWTGWSAYDVDHLFNQARARRQDYYLRIEAIPWQLNRQHGNTYERHLSGRPGEKDRKKIMRQLTGISILKLAGLEAPESPNDEQRIRVFRRFLLHNQRLTPAEAAIVVDGLLEEAFGT